MNALFAAIGFPEVLLIAGTFSISILVTVLWVWMLIVCIRRVVEGDQRQIPWLVAMIVTTGLGAVVYWIVVHRRYHRPAPKPHTALRNPVYCPHCGKPLTTLSVQGICPECMLQAGLGTQGPDATEAKFTPPSIEKLAPYFPQLELLELLGRGGMGAVYKARQRELNRLVALKVLPSEKAERDPAFAERFAREARALAQLAHPNIVAVHDFGQAGGHCYLLMEYVDGLNLRQLLQRGTMKPEEAVAIVPFICEALQFAHQHGIVHRDIKPENILVDSQGRVKIADFGIAKIIGAETERTNLTEPRQTIGTPHYMAPEQVEKPSTVDHRADIYSLGVVFYEMLTGELPLGRFASPSQKVQVDVRLDEVVLRALEKEPSRRYQQASQVKTAVDTILSEPIGSQSMRQTPKPGASLNYRSKATLFGLPLLHVTDGNDPETGLPRVARGIIAVGPVAIGAVAAGGRAQGLIAFWGIGDRRVRLWGMRDRNRFNRRRGPGPWARARRICSGSRRPRWRSRGRVRNGRRGLWTPRHGSQRERPDCPGLLQSVGSVFVGAHRLFYHARVGRDGAFPPASVLASATTSIPFPSVGNPDRDHGLPHADRLGFIACGRH
jgi:predicted Ser/Thr protein kinase